MPNDNYCHITFILDRSGSMDSIRDDVIGGFNRFIDEQKAAPGECTLTLVQFDSQDPYEILRDFTPIAQAQHIGDEYRPRSNTPLYDAIGRGIINTGEKLAALPEDKRPGKVVFAILTDGLENASREYDRAKVAAMTKEQVEKWKWQFVYLGANQDAMAEGGKVGVVADFAADYDTKHTKHAIQVASSNVRSYRSGAAPDMAWTDSQRKELKGQS